MKILILGGTGAMGVHLVKLLNNGHNDIYVTSRSYRKSSNNLTYLQGNALEDKFFISLIENQWNVIIDFMVYSTGVFKCRVELLLKASSQYIFLSTARVFANSEMPILEKSFRLLDVSTDKYFLLTDEYSLIKARQEDLLQKSMHKNWTIIRPYITYGEHRLQLGVLEKEDWLYRALKGRTIVFSKDIATKLSTLTYGLDVSKAISKIIGKEEALATEFNITNDQSISWIEVLNIYLEVLENYLGYRPKVLLQDLPDFLKHHTTKYQVIYDRLYDRKFNNSKISKIIKHKEFIEIEIGLKNCLIEFLKKPTYNLIDWRKEAIKDKTTGEFTSFKEIKKTKDILRYLKYRFFKKNSIKNF